MNVYRCLFEPTADPKAFRCACGSKASSSAAIAYPCRLNRGPAIEPQMPSLARRAANFGQAMAGWAADGFSLAGDELTRARLAICQTCDLRVGDKCSHPKCGCFLRAKAAIKSEKCPLGKWDKANAEVGRMNDESKQAEPHSSFIIPTSSLPSVTFAITAFERPRHLERLVASIEQYYPGARIVVADNGTRKATLPALVRQIEVPYDCGLSAARNALLDALETPYMMLLDDDYIFTRETRIERLRDVLDYHPEVGLVGGRLENRQQPGAAGPRQAYAVDAHVFRSFLFETAATGLVRVTDSGVPYRLCYKVYNFALGRREFFAEHRWDPSLKLGEHAAFFHAVQRGRWLVANCPSVVAIHDMGARDAVYAKSRSRARDFHRDWYARAGLVGHKQEARLHNLAVEPPRPNILVFGVGHSGTTILTRMLGAVGWQLPGADEQYAENVELREINHRMLAERASFSRGELAARLRALGEPWAVKDPRFIRTLEKWLPAFADLERPPLLVWIRRQAAGVLASYQRRGAHAFTAARLRAAMALAEAGYDLWPWAKLSIDYEQLAAAHSLFVAR